MGQEVLATQERLSGRQVLLQVYTSLFTKWAEENIESREIVFSSKARAEIANDSDHHRRRVGHTHYTRAALLVGEKNEWAISPGSTNGCDYDLAVISVSLNGKSEEEVIREIQATVEKGSCFCYSPIFINTIGELEINTKNWIGEKISEFLDSNPHRSIEGFLAHDPRIDVSYLDMNLQPEMHTIARYDTGVVRFLSNVFYSVLAF